MASGECPVGCPSVCVLGELADKFGDELAEESTGETVGAAAPSNVGINIWLWSPNGVV